MLEKQARHDFGVGLLEGPMTAHAGPRLVRIPVDANHGSKYASPKEMFANHSKEGVPPMKNSYVLTMSGLAVVALALSFPTENHAQIPPTRQLISESALLAGLAPGALFPFIDSTPRSIARAHIAITDATATCVAGQGAPFNIQILAGVAGGSLVNVATAATNTGIGSPTQCVFHVTITPGAGGVPARVTDIVVVNSNGSAALTGINTITVSAEVY